MFDISPNILLILLIPLLLQWVGMIHAWRNGRLSPRDKILWILFLATFPIISLVSYTIYAFRIQHKHNF